MAGRAHSDAAQKLMPKEGTRLIGWLSRNRKYLLIAVAGLLALAAFVVFVTPAWAWHPLGYCSGNAPAIKGCKGYNFYSGIGANFGELTLLVGIAVFWLKHNCYEHGCPWVGRVKGDDGHLRCKGHHKRTHPDYQTSRAEEKP